MSQSPHSPLPAMRVAAQSQGLARLARVLGTNPTTLGSYLAGTARAGTVVLLETRFKALQTPPEQPRS